MCDYMEVLQNMDMNLLKLINTHTHNPLFDWLMPIISTLGNGGAIWIAIALLLISIKKYRRIGILTLLSLGVTALLGEGIIKNLVQRPRPFTVIPSISLLINAPISYSFPSGHTASSFAAALILSRYFKSLRIYIWIMACAMAFSRMYLYVHYPIDILGGIALGTLVSAVVLRSNAKILEHRKSI